MRVSLSHSTQNQAALTSFSFPLVNEVVMMERTFFHSSSLRTVRNLSAGSIINPSMAFQIRFESYSQDRFKQFSRQHGCMLLTLRLMKLAESLIMTFLMNLTSVVRITGVDEPSNTPQVPSKLCMVTVSKPSNPWVITSSIFPKTGRGLGPRIPSRLK